MSKGYEKSTELNKQGWILISLYLPACLAQQHPSKNSVEPTHRQDIILYSKNDNDNRQEATE
jgi:hypothetical protein